MQVFEERNIAERGNQKYKALENDKETPVAIVERSEYWEARS